MFKILSICLFFTNVYSQVVGNARDDNDCLISAGYSWCESSQSCIRSWETPCEDNFASCDDCFNKQRKGMNIACPQRCDVIDYPMPTTDMPMPTTDMPMPMPMPMPKPIEIPHSCPEVMCMMYCENGMVQDSNGCNTCECNDPMIAIDPMPSIHAIDPVISTPPVPAPVPAPVPHVINPFLKTCNINQMTVYHECNSDCHNCDFSDSRNVLSDCMNNGLRASDDLCQGDIHSCSIPYHDCDNEFVCPKITEITDCGENGLDGYSTYRLSLIVKNSFVKNIFAIYGDDDSEIHPKPMIIPPAYQSIINFNNNIGGISPTIINIDPESRYDSWLTIGVTDGDINDEIMTVGIDFPSWTESNGIRVSDGAVFTLDPSKNIVDGDEYVVAQITIPNGESSQLILNAEGKTNCGDCNTEEYSWKQESIIFNINPPKNNLNTIPKTCSTWYDGCNNCQVRNGQIGACTRMMCFIMDNPRCLSFETSGH